MVNNIEGALNELGYEEKEIENKNEINKKKIKNKGEKKLKDKKESVNELFLSLNRKYLPKVIEKKEPIIHKIKEKIKDGK